MTRGSFRIEPVSTIPGPGPLIAPLHADTSDRYDLVSMAPPTTPDTASEGTVRRALRDFKAFSERYRVRAIAATLTCGFATASTLLADDLGLWERVTLAVGGVIGGALVVGLITSVWFLFRTPSRQRDEARGDLIRLAGISLPPSALAFQFSEWVTEMRAARPSPPPIDLAMTFVADAKARDLARVEHAAARQRYREMCDEIERQARVAYHARWRDAVLKVCPPELGGPREAREPRTFKDLAVVEEALNLAALPAARRGPEATKQLRAKLDQGHELLSAELAHALGGDYSSDPLYRWALATWRLLRSDFTEYAREFYGPHPQAGEGYFATAFFSETGHDRRAYLEARLAQIEHILRLLPSDG